MLENCDNCGACCKYVFLVQPNPILSDLEKFRGMIKTKQGYTAIPCKCCYFDEKTKRCTIYEKRPDNCRKFEINSKLCLLSREVEGL